MTFIFQHHNDTKEHNTTEFIMWIKVNSQSWAGMLFAEVNSENPQKKEQSFHKRAIKIFLQALNGYLF